MLREETVEPGTLGLLKQMVALPEMKQYRLGGGTALSLLYGHRKSIDLDFFTDQPHNLDVLIPILEKNFGRVIPINERFKAIYQCEIQNVKVDLVSVTDSFSNPIQLINNIPFADTKDLIALKLNAVKGRGVKKDFWDLAKLLEYYSFKELFQFYHDRYPYDDTMSIMRCVVYFNDAENNPEPIALDGMTWKKVKNIIKKSIEEYYKN